MMRSFSFLVRALLFIIIMLDVMWVPIWINVLMEVYLCHSWGNVLNLLIDLLVHFDY